MLRCSASLPARLVAALAAVALVLLGAAHRTHAPVDTALLAFLSAGGSAADICHETPDTPAGHGHHDCPACTLAKSLLAPEAAPVPRLAALLLGREAPPPAGVPHPAHPPRAPPARGPPLAQA